MANLYLMVGIPGSGKSHYLQTYVNWNNAIVSRDKIRFMMLKDGENYYAHEKEVEKEFYNQINIALMNGIDTYADATHISKQSRAKTLKHVTAPYDKVVAIVMETSIANCCERDSKRTGRSKVGEQVIYNMNMNYSKPTLEEGFDMIVTIKEKEYE